MAVAKVAQHEPLEEAELQIDQSALVIGGGLSGMTAARALADQGYPVHLVEKDDQLGGQARHLFKTAKGEDIQAETAAMVREIESHPNIRLHLGASLAAVDGFVGNFDTTVDQSGRQADNSSRRDHCGHRCPRNTSPRNICTAPIQGSSPAWSWTAGFKKMIRD